MRILCVIALVLLTSFPSRAETGVQTILTKKQVVFGPRPHYPYQARANHITGAGICVLTVRPDGTVQRAEMAVSTGHGILDEATLDAFRQWRFVPGATKKVKIPIRFSVPSRAKNPKA